MSYKRYLEVGGLFTLPQVRTLPKNTNYAVSNHVKTSSDHEIT